MHVVIVGAGIAGASAAYYAHHQGHRVTLVDAARERASDVPVALVNPVRGTGGKVIEGGFAATRWTFGLVDRLRANGHDIGYGRGLCRPVPDQATMLQWQARMPEGESWQWREVDAALNLCGDWYQVLYLPEAGWIETGPMLSALIEESHATRVSGLVHRVDLDVGEVCLDDGRRIRGDLLLWCGGAFGAGLTGPGPQKFRPGSVLVLEQPLSALAVSYGIYAAPFGEKGLVGSTSEPPTSSYSSVEVPPALARLERRVASMWHRPSATLASFRGVRFERLPSTAPLPGGISTLDGFGSRGYLLAPTAASAWADRLSG